MTAILQVGEVLWRVCLNEDFFMLDNIPLKYVHCGLINNNPASVQVMVWQQSSGKPVFELTMTWWKEGLFSL